MRRSRVTWRDGGSAGRKLLVSLAVLFLGAPVPAGPAPELEADHIIDRAVARARAQRDAGADAGFVSVIRSETRFLGGDGDVEKTERETYRQYPVEGELFEELVAREEKSLDETERREQSRRREAFARKIRGRRAAGGDPASEDDSRVRFDREFVDRYRFALAGEETVDGHLSWIIHLEPKEGNLPVRRQIDHALNQATGRIWVSQRDYGIPRVEFEMARSVRFWGGILGTLRHSEGRLEFARVEDGVWLPTRVDIQFDLRILFRNLRRRVVREWSEYLPASRAALSWPEGQP